MSRVLEYVGIAGTVGGAVGFGGSEMKILFAILFGVGVIVYLFARHLQKEREDELVRILRDAGFRTEGDNIMLPGSQNGNPTIVTILDVPETARALTRLLRKTSPTK